MKNCETIAKLINESMGKLQEALNYIEEKEETPAETPKTKGKIAPAKSAKAPAKDTDNTPAKGAKKTDKDNSSEYTAEQLSEMSYNDLKKLCKELGIPAIGSRTQIVEKILGGAPAFEEDEDEEPEEEVKSTKKDKAESKKPVPKKSAPKVEEPEDDEDEDEEEEESDTLKLVLEATEDMEVEEIAELLSENGLSAKGKRQALIDRLVKAIDDGIISFDDEDEEEEADEEEADDENESEDEDDSDTNPDIDEMTKARAKAFNKLSKEAKSNFESGKLKIKAVKKYVSDYYNGEEDLSEYSDEEIFEHYLELLSLTVDDNGDVAESEEPYIINDRAYCCGHPCDFSEEDGTYTCSVCSGEYEAE